MWGFRLRLGTVGGLNIQRAWGMATMPVEADDGLRIGRGGFQDLRTELRRHNPPRTKDAAPRAAERA